jgi:hypothetical protein
VTVVVIEQRVVVVCATKVTVDLGKSCELIGGDGCLKVDWNAAEGEVDSMGGIPVEGSIIEDGIIEITVVDVGGPREADDKSVAVMALLIPVVWKDVVVVDWRGILVVV